MPLYRDPDRLPNQGSRFHPAFARETPRPCSAWPVRVCDLTHQLCSCLSPQVDVRFATARQVLDDASYPPTRNGRSPFVPLGVNFCAELVLAEGAPRFDWCYNEAFATNASSVNTGTVYMATGYIKSKDGSQLSLFSVRKRFCGPRFVYK
jgi:hypothetical protein